ncbi:MAG: hypothetical protein HONBIEJF_01177 [Fimbriimonadaceae bacterium]|nr:hypothetical protein [Fimbriimonadaceae bacterium]
MLDCQVADTAPGVDLPSTVLINDAACRAGVDARTASSAATSCGQIGRELLRRQQRAKEEPASPSRVDNHGVLADPAKTGPNGELSFQERCRIDANSKLGIGVETRQGSGDASELSSYDAVIVSAQSVRCDAGHSGLMAGRLGIVKPHHEDGPNARQQVRWVFLQGGMAEQVRHLTVIAFRQPGLISGHRLRRCCLANAHKLESFFSGTGPGKLSCVTGIHRALAIRQWEPDGAERSEPVPDDRGPR